jgi:hypothetical protein
MQIMNHVVKRGYIWMGYQGSFQDFPEATEIRVSTDKIEFGTITLLPMRNTCVTINHGCVPFVVNTWSKGK